MKAAVFEAYRGPLEIRTVADPACPPDGVVLKIEACGVCRSDHHGWSGVDPDVALPHVPGHEFAGTVIAAGADCRGFRLGDRVTAPFILACGICPDCRGGEPTVCNHQHVVGFSGWGAFAEMLAVPRADFNLVKLPEQLGFAEAAAMGCRLTTAFRGLVDRARLEPGEWLAIHGCGGVGLSAVMVGAALGAQVLAIDINDEALAMARRLGIRTVAVYSDADARGTSPAAAPMSRLMASASPQPSTTRCAASGSSAAMCRSASPWGRMQARPFPCSRRSMPGRSPFSARAASPPRAFPPSSA